MSFHSRSYSNCCLYPVGPFPHPYQINHLFSLCRFINGRCKNSSCPYSHDLTPGKMPTCSYFIKGACGQDNCPYAHSYVGHDAQICDDFVQGFCGKGIEVCVRGVSFHSSRIFLCNSSVFETTCSSLSTI